MDDETSLISPNGSDIAEKSGICWNWFKDGALPYSFMLALIIVSMITCFLLFDPFNIFKRRVLSDNPDVYKAEDLKYEQAGWGVVVLTGSTVGAFCANKVIYGNVETAQESEITKCPGILYLGIFIVSLIFMIIVMAFFDPFNIWHKWSYKVDDDDPCSVKLFEKHKLDMEIGGWVIMLFGAFFVGSAVGYANFFGRTIITSK